MNSVFRYADRRAVIVLVEKGSLADKVCMKFPSRLYCTSPLYATGRGGGGRCSG